jgi:glucose/arabinose dehydrogenase
MSCRGASVSKIRLASYMAGVCICTGPYAAQAGTVANPICPVETAFFNPTAPVSIRVPDGYSVSQFAAGLNMPTGLAFLRKGNGFEVYVLESGHGLPSRCNEQDSPAVGGTFSSTNPFTPDILVFDQRGTLLRKIAKPTAPSVGFQTAGPSVDIAFENGFQGGRLFATDSNQATHAAGQNNSSRIVTVDPQSGKVTPFITGLPTGDHPTEQLAFQGDWIFWSQGSTTNSGVVGRDNGGGANQPDIPCQDITLSNNVFDSGGGVFTSGYSNFGTQRPGAVVRAFEGATHPGVCDGAILAAKLHGSNDPASTIRPFSWGYRNGYAIRFAPEDHPLKGGLIVGEDGPDERGARPSNNAPDALHLAQVNKDGTPDYHGWPDRFGFLASTQAVFNPIGGPSDDLWPDVAKIQKEDVPIRDVLAFPPQQITAPLALEAADSSFTGVDFVPNSFVRGPVQRGAALYSLEGDFGFSPPNSRATDPAGEPFVHEVGHEIKLLNFSTVEGPLQLKMQEFARNASGDQAFIANNTNAFNRPTNIRFGPDGCAWVADYGAVRDGGGGEPPGPNTTTVINPADGPLVQIPGTGVIWRICPR